MKGGLFYLAFFADSKIFKTCSFCLGDKSRVGKSSLTSLPPANPCWSCCFWASVRISPNCIISSNFSGLTLGVASLGLFPVGVWDRRGETGTRTSVAPNSKADSFLIIMVMSERLRTKSLETDDKPWLFSKRAFWLPPTNVGEAISQRLEKRFLSLGELREPWLNEEFQLRCGIRTSLGEKVEIALTL